MPIDIELTPTAAKAALDAGSLVLVDVRTLPEWEIASVPGSVHIPLDEIEKRSDEIEIVEGQQLATLCHHGVRSLKAAHALRALGFPQAKSVAGGIEAWSRTADATVPRYARAGGVCTPVV